MIVVFDKKYLQELYHTEKSSEKNIVSASGCFVNIETAIEFFTRSIPICRHLPNTMG